MFFNWCIPILYVFLENLAMVSIGLLIERNCKYQHQHRIFLFYHPLCSHLWFVQYMFALSSCNIIELSFPTNKSHAPLICWIIKRWKSILLYSLGLLFSGLALNCQTTNNNMGQARQTFSLVEGIKSIFNESYLRIA